MRKGRRNSRQRSWRLRVLRGLVLALLAGFAVSAAVVLGLRWVDPPFTAVMWLESGPWRDIDYRWVDRSAIAPAAARAVIAAEDQKFLDHHGFDLGSLRDAVETYRAGGDLRGASTISQQVAKNLFLWNGRSFARKALEAYFTVLIEACWSKQRILEVYLNVAELGEGVFGVEAAAERFFAESAGRLNARDAALLAAVLPSPKRMNAGHPSEYVRQRQAEILEQMRLLEQRGHYRGLEW